MGVNEGIEYVDGMNGFERGIKRVFDFCGALIMLIFSLPLIFVIWIALMYQNIK